MNRSLGGLPLWMWGIGAAAIVGAAAFFKRKSATAAAPTAKAAPANAAFSSQQQLQDFGIFQSLTQGQQGSDLQYLSTVLSLFGGSGASAGGTSSNNPGGVGGGATTTVPVASGAGPNPGGTATAIPATGNSVPAGSVSTYTGPPGAVEGTNPLSPGATEPVGTPYAAPSPTLVQPPLYQEQNPGAYDPAYNPTTGF